VVEGVHNEEEELVYDIDLTRTGAAELFARARYCLRTYIACHGAPFDRESEDFVRQQHRQSLVP
jgi:hypothetical protein